MVSRRTFLLGALGSVVLAAGGSVVAIEDGVLPGRTRLAALVGAVAGFHRVPDRDANLERFAAAG